MSNRYWHCIIGPVDSSIVPEAADLRPRIAALEAIEQVTGVYSSSVRCTSAWIGEPEYRRLKAASDPETQVLDKHVLDKPSELCFSQGQIRATWGEVKTREEMARRQAEGARQRGPLTSAEIAGAMNWCSYSESLGWSRRMVKAVEPESPSLWDRLKKRWIEFRNLR
jgi:hypothetical protein